MEEPEDVEGPTRNPRNAGMASMSRFDDEFEERKDGEDAGVGDEFEKHEDGKDRKRARGREGTIVLGFNIPGGSEAAMYVSQHVSG